MMHSPKAHAGQAPLKLRAGAYRSLKVMADPLEQLELRIDRLEFRVTRRLERLEGKLRALQKRFVLFALLGCFATMALTLLLARWLWRL